MSNDDDDPTTSDVEPGVAVAVRERKKREGARPKVRAQRELRREVFRYSLEHRTNEKAVADLREARPQTRGDCCDGPRPCPWVACKYHLYLSVNPESGAITFNFPDKEVWEMEDSCALDVADRGGTTLERVGQIANVTRERIRQVETKALIQLRSTRTISSLKDD